MLARIRRVRPDTSSLAYAEERAGTPSLSSPPTPESPAIPSSSSFGAAINNPTRRNRSDSHNSSSSLEGMGAVQSSPSKMVSHREFGEISAAVPSDNKKG